MVLSACAETEAACWTTEVARAVTEVLLVVYQELRESVYVDCLVLVHTW